MLSRRIVRIKVMQFLYALSRDPELTTQDVINFYRKGVQKNLEFYVFNIYHFLKTVDYAFKDADIRKKKLRRMPEDEAFTPKIADNPMVRSLARHPWVLEQFKKFGFEDKISEDTIRKYYTDFSKTEAYQKFLLNPDSTEEDLLEILLGVNRFLLSNESFNEDMDDFYYSWEDDKTLVAGAMKKTIRALPALDTFYADFLPEEEVVTDFGENLLKKVALREKELLEVIDPNLKNWDADRVAIVDMILIKMGMVEFTDFPTIPTKVTLNEYVELTKLYSTEKSKDFVNGILDRILKKMEKEELIVKQGRGLVE